MRPFVPLRVLRGWHALVVVLVALAAPSSARAEPLGLNEAVRRGLASYQGLAVKRAQIEVAGGQARASRDAYLPDVTVAAQQSFGTANGAFGPQTPIGLLGISSAGPVWREQSWNSAFGANYLLGASWEFFTFGRVDARIDAADASVRRAKADLEQERFVHGIKVAGTYLDLLVARSLVRVADANLERASTVLGTVTARTGTGLQPEVDRSSAEAEVSRARLARIDAVDREQRLRTQLATFLGARETAFELDESYLTRAPARFGEGESKREHPQIAYQSARVEEAERAAAAQRRAILPGFNLVATYHARASGFDDDYNPDNGRYTLSYPEGVFPKRSNYVIGITLSFNLMSPIKNRGPSAVQEEQAAAFREERALLRNQLGNQRDLADQRIENVRAIMREVPRQYDAAQAAYRQKNALYGNGLADLVEVQQALYALSRAEADKSVASVALWQALLQKAAATGDYSLFSSQVGAP